MSEEELVAQMAYVIFATISDEFLLSLYISTLIAAATDTTSGALSQILDILAKHPDAQERLREEILQASNGEDISYDQLIELPYMDAVCRETLRLYVQYVLRSDPFLTPSTRYPPVTEVHRECVILPCLFTTGLKYLLRSCKKDMVLPLANPIRGLNGKWMSEIFVPKNTRIIVAIRACNRNKEIWGEDALEWKPERWLSPLPGSLTDARVPGVYSNM